MRRFISSWVLGAVTTALLVRAVGGWLREWRGLALTGELADRLARRRTRELVRVAVQAGIPPSPDPVGRRPGLHASVHVGRIAQGDVDDMGLLEAAMRTAARTRAASAANQRAMAEKTQDTPVHSPRESAPAWSSATAVVGVLVTLIPLVRPLGAPAPIFAAFGLALVLAAWFGARRAGHDR